MKILILGPYKQKIFKNYRVEELINFLNNDSNKVFHTDKKINLNYLRKRNINFVISNGYSHKIPSKIIDKYPNKIINLHNAYLPWGRGVGVNLFCLIKGLPTGISIHNVDKDWDTGPILIRKLINPKKTESFRNFYLRLLNETNKMFIENWNLIKNNKLKKINQKKIRVDTTNRLRTEYLLEYFNNSYDVKIKELLKFRNIFLNNEEFYKQLQK